MGDIVFREVTLWMCPECSGVWINRDAVDDIRSLSDKDFDKLEELQKPEIAHPTEPMVGRCCPDDLNLLRRFEHHFFPSILVDGCDQCNGIWLDDDEVTKVAEIVEKFRARPTAPAPSTTAAQEAAIMEVGHIAEIERTNRIESVFNVLRHRFLWPGL
jgi:Zn-finger nucleic acid-binding protein